MKSLTLFFCLVLLSTVSFAQATKSITRDTLTFIEKYDVLKTDKQFKQGSYLLKTAFSYKTLTSGFYKNNKRDSIWRRYDTEGKILTEGYYKDGLKRGEWAYYDYNGNLTDKYDFTKNELIFHRRAKDDSTRKYPVIKGADTLFIHPGRPPIYLGGDMMMYNTLMYIVRYPQEARTLGISGKVLVTFVVDENGHISNYKVAKGIGHGCDEEALKAVKLIPPDWIPAQMDGKNVAVLIGVPITFNLGGR